MAPMMMLGACSLEYSDKEITLSDDPVFVLQGANNGLDYRYSAGEDSIYMFTNYRLNNGGGYEFTGRFAAERCADNDACPGQMAFTIRGNSPLLLFLQKNYPFINEEADSIITFTCIATDTIGSLVQLHTNRGSAVAPLPLLLNTTDTTVPLTVEKTDKATGTKITLRTEIMPDQPDRCAIPVIEAQVVNNMVQMQADPAFSDAVFSWGGGYSAQFPYQPGQQYPITITHPSGCSFVITFQNLPSGAPNAIFSSPKLSFMAHRQAAVLQTGAMVQFVNDSGEIFVAPAHIQDSLSYFNVSQINEYLRNENGQRTVQLNIDFRCNLRQQNAVSITPTHTITGKGVIAVGIP